MHHRARLSRWCVVCIVLGGLFWLQATWAGEAGPKKLIYYGWGLRDTQYVREHWREMEQMPFDGTGIIVAVDRQAWQGGRQATDNQLGWQLMRRPWFGIDILAEVIIRI